jgi:hypothetical protein
MLQTLEGREITSVCHKEDFDALVRRLSNPRADAIRDFLNQRIDRMSTNGKTGLRTFSASGLGRDLTPWPEPLAYLYQQSRDSFGQIAAREAEIEDRAAQWFGLFVWDVIMARPERWVFYDPNLRAADPERDPVGKVYFETAWIEGMEATTNALLSQMRSLGWIVKTFRVNGTVEMHAVHLACKKKPQIARCNDGDGPNEEYRCVCLLAEARGRIGGLKWKPISMSAN